MSKEFDDAVDKVVVALADRRSQADATRVARQQQAAHAAAQQQQRLAIFQAKKALVDKVIENANRKFAASQQRIKLTASMGSDLQDGSDASILIRMGVSGAPPTRTAVTTTLQIELLTSGKVSGIIAQRGGKRTAVFGPIEIGELDEAKLEHAVLGLIQRVAPTLPI